MKKNKVLIILSLLIIVIVIYFFYKKSNDIKKYLLVKNYINKTYGRKCNITNSSFAYNEFGITGGLYMYSFNCKDEEGKEYVVTYSAHQDLTDETLYYLRIQK